MTPKEVLDAMESAVTAADACYRVNSDREFADHMLMTLRDAGFAVVPREPTDAMCRTAALAIADDESTAEVLRRAMLAAAEGE